MIAALCLGLSLAPGAALADDDDIGDIVEDLREDWLFTDIQLTTSMLGRVQIRASNQWWIREMVVNPRTGEVLRDVWFDLSGKVISRPEEPDDDDDDDEDDDDD